MSNQRIEAAGLSLTEEQLEALKAGATISGSSKSLDVFAPSASAPRNTVPIKGYGTELRPRVAGNDPSQGLVEGPSGDWAAKHADQWQAEAAQEAARLKQQDESKAALTNESLRRDLEALRRQIKRLEKQVKETKTDA